MYGDVPINMGFFDEAVASKKIIFFDVVVFLGVRSCMRARLSVSMLVCTTVRVPVLRLIQTTHMIVHLVNTMANHR